MKSVLHIGINCAQYSSKGMEKGFKEAGFNDYHFFPWQDIRLNEGVLGCQARMIQAANSIMPDLIFLHLQNPDIVDVETAIELSKCGFAVNYTFDVRGPELTEWYYDLAPSLGLTLFACQEDVDEAKRRGIDNVGHMHSSCDYEQYRPIEAFIEAPEIVFLGNNYADTNMSFEGAKERLEMVNFMKTEFGDRFGCFGMGWGPESRYINPIEEVNIYNSAKIVICHNNYKRTSYCSDRQWRSIACGAYTIAHYYNGIEKEANLEYWSSLDELAELCELPLVNSIYRIHAAKQDHSDFFLFHKWKNRIQQMLLMINERIPKISTDESDSK